MAELVWLRAFHEIYDPVMAVRVVHELAERFPDVELAMIGPDKRVKAMIVYPMSTGRNFDEVLRLLDSLQLTARQAVATPVNWTPGDDVIIPATVSDEEARKKYPGGWKTLTPYLRLVAQPR